MQIICHSRYRVTFIWVAALLLLPATRSHAQAAYRAAGGSSSIVPRKYGFFTADFAEAGLGLTFVAEPTANCDYGECDAAGVGFTGYVSVSARNGRGDILSDFDFAPGLAVGGRIYHAFNQNGARYDVFYLTLGYANRQLRIAEQDALRGTLTFDERYQHRVSGSAGYNHTFGFGTAIGIMAEAGRELGSIGVDTTSEICVPATYPFSGVTYRACSNRYYRDAGSPLPDLWIARLRTDLSLGVATLGESESLPTIAIVAAGSAGYIETTDVTVNLGLGAALMPAGFPGQSFVTLMAGLNDALDANEVAPSFGSRFVASLTLGIPFPLIIRR